MVIRLKDKFPETANSADKLWATCGYYVFAESHLSKLITLAASAFLLSLGTIGFPRTGQLSLRLALFHPAGGASRQRTKAFGNRDEFSQRLNLHLLHNPVAMRFDGALRRS